jgi:hypothetical protein
MCHIPTTVQCSNAVRSNPKKLPNEIPMSFNTGTCDMQAMNMKDLTPITYPPNIPLLCHIKALWKFLKEILLKRKAFLRFCNQAAWLLLPNCIT